MVARIITAIPNAPLSAPCLKRRSFIRSFMQLSALAVLPPAPVASAVKNLPKNSRKSLRYISAAQLNGHQAAIGLNFEPEGEAVTRLQAALSDFRGHQVLAKPGRPHEILMIGRRPETRALSFNLNTGESGLAFETSERGHLFGHACFSADGNYLYTTEARLDSQDGVIVVRNANNYECLHEFSSYGIGPHELCVSHDNKHIIVANGGLLTRPNTGRQVLNPETMQPSLAYINIDSGALEACHKLSQEKASIRHIAVATTGEVSVATQLQRSALTHNEVLPLCALYSPDQGLQFLTAPPTLYGALNDYVGSTAISSRHRIAGFSSPKGNLAVFWHIDHRELIGYYKFHDVCGLATTADENYFVLSNSSGEIRHLNAVSLDEDKSMRLRIENIVWDNHLAIV